MIYTKGWKLTLKGHIAALHGVLCLCALFCQLPAYAEDLRVRSDDWCPYNCAPGSKEPGYVIELLQMTFEPLGMRVDYQQEPWSRANIELKEGHADVAIGLPRSTIDREHFVSGIEPIAITSDCLYVSTSREKQRDAESWMNSLSTLGLTSDYVFDEPFSVWLGRPENAKKIVYERGEFAAENKFRSLERGRISGLLEDQGVAHYLINKLGLEKKVYEAVCGPADSLYVGFTSASKSSRHWASLLDENIAKLRRAKQLNKLLGRYNQTDWNADR